MRDARSKEGSISDNPLHRELLEIASIARHDFILDVVLARDRTIAGVFAGHPEEAHKRGVEMVSQAMMQTLEEPVDAVITTSAGYPLDLTFYQAIKGVTAAQHILKPGGKILLFAACGEGAGAAEFQKMLLEGKTDHEFLDHIANSPVTVDQWQLEKLAMVERRSIRSPGIFPAFPRNAWQRYGARFTRLRKLPSPTSPMASIPAQRSQ